VTHDILPPAADAELARLAREILSRRRLRANFFDTQIFGEHGWEILLHLYTVQGGTATIERIGDSLKTSGAAIMALSRLLGSMGLVAQGDSDSGWGEIPLHLTAAGQAKVSEYLLQLQNGRLAA
jgi:hypothetical protein